MKIYKLKIIVALLAFSLSIGGVSYLSSLFERKAVITEVSAQTGKILPELNSNKNESAKIQKETIPFKDYPVDEIYKGRNAPLKLKRKDEIEREQLKSAIDNQKVDFAGHYIVAGWSCGMWCNLNPIIDAKTGVVYLWNGILSVCLPDSDKDFDCNENFSNVEYRIDSKLIVFFGSRSGKEGDRGFHHYKFENGRFIHLKSVPVKEQRNPLQIKLDKLDEKTDDNKKPEK